MADCLSNKIQFLIKFSNKIKFLGLGFGYNCQDFEVYGYKTNILIAIQGKSEKDKGSPFSIT